APAAQPVDKSTDSVDVNESVRSEEDDDPVEIHGDDFDFGEVAATSEEEEEVLPDEEVVEASGPEFDLGAGPEESERDAFHLTPEQQAILTGGSLMSLDDFPVEFSLPPAEDRKDDKNGKDSGTMMSLDDFPEPSDGAGNPNG
ncbi:MAG: hypothetical protein Q4C47_05990, partial [Planctomycetia bacterium]|nr:hypothetical protein [Planctomycetia bacterium]